MSDEANRVRSMTTAGALETFTYDGHGRRTRATTSSGTLMHFYTQAGQALFSENPATPSSLIKSRQYHIYLGNRRIAQKEMDALYYIHNDHLGSLLARTSTTGSLVESTPVWEPWGAPTGIGSSGRGLRYAGHYTDFATGLSYMQQRYYDPYAGRFLAVDPVAASSGSFNRYWYANNNPYKYTDPDGQASKVAYLVRLTATGMRKVAALSQEQAVLARRSGENVLSARRQISSQIERAAFPNADRMKHAAHELDDGTKGLPHYQTEGKIGHSFWGKLGGAALAASTFLDNLADAAEYLPDAAPRPATGDDIDRTNGVINLINEKTSSNIPNFSKNGIGEFQGVFRVDGRVDENRLNEEMKRK